MPSLELTLRFRVIERHHSSFNKGDFHLEVVNSTRMSLTSTHCIYNNYSNSSNNSSTTNVWSRYMTVAWTTEISSLMVWSLVSDPLLAHAAVVLLAHFTMTSWKNSFILPNNVFPHSTETLNRCMQVLETSSLTSDEVLPFPCNSSNSAEIHLRARTLFLDLLSVCLLV